MKFIALISGGKDSFFNIYNCLSLGHELVAIGNLYPFDSNVQEIDSFMFQTVGHDIINYYSQCLDVPLYRQKIHSKSSINQNLEYEITENDEIEDLYQLLSTIKSKHPEIQGVSCGAILSHYQRTRVENVCDRLGLTSLTYLWQRNQYDLMNEMCMSDLDARIIKVAAIGLNENHLGKSLREMFPTLVKLNQLYDVHICGEGGEFETLVLDCEFFKSKRLQIIGQQIVKHSNDDVCYLKLNVELVDKKRSEFVNLSPPALLEESFEELLDVEAPIISVKNNNTLSNIIPEICTIATSTKLYISNISSHEDSIERQVEEAFDILNTHLKRINLTNNDIQHITLLIKDMNDFAKINKVYSKQFQEINLPPSRVCVETNISSFLQMSVVALKNIHPKAGIHIRSRSYWGPQNIGPYSQSIVDHEKDYKLASLSGQIPLIPSTMELSSKDIIFNSTLSLQHLHRVKDLVNIRKLCLTICFITDINHVSVVQKVWDKYIKDVDPESSDSLVIAKVSKLPRNAPIEWSGFTFENVVDMYDDEDENEEKSWAKEIDPQYSKFDNYSIFNIGKGKLQIMYLFTSNSSLIKHFETNHYTILICNPNDYTAINAEYLPVETVFDKNGKSFLYCLLLMIEH